MDGPPGAMDETEEEKEEGGQSSKKESIDALISKFQLENQAFSCRV
jgi:hypothetical protein